MSIGRSAPGLLGFWLMTSSAIVQGPQEAKTSTRDVMAGTARVERVDRSTRSISLSTDQGLKHTVYVGRELAVFDQLRTGDTVFVRVAESVVVALKPGARPTSLTDKTAAARKQPTPRGGEVLQQLTIVVTIESVDLQQQIVSYRGGDNRSVTRYVADGTLLQGLHPGDVVEITYTRERAIELEKR